VEQAEKALEMEKVKFAPKFEALGMRLPQEPVKQSGGFWSWLMPSATPVSTMPSGPPATPLEAKRRKLEFDYQSKKIEIYQEWKLVGEEATPIQVKPRKTDVRVTHFGLAWAPC
jgi:hypothetical protein